MAFKFFTVPIQDGGRAEGELNGFLRSHKVLSVDRRWVEQGASSFWSFCVDYLETSSGSGGDGRPAGQRGKVDYKEVLNPEEFAVFARLREVRKEIVGQTFLSALCVRQTGMSAPPTRGGIRC